jgi:hypothetical protein
VARGVAAQSVRGEVLSAATLTPLPYSTVALDPAFAPRFSDDAGRFAFVDVPPGTYRLILKHIGYVPFDTVLTVSAGHDVVIRATLASLAVELPPVTVVAGQTCTAPGAPDAAAHPQLAAIFGQLRENAGRFTLLADAYPFRHWVLRAQQVGEAIMVDTVEYRSDTRRRYAPGRLVVTSGSPRGPSQRLLNLPTIADLADPVFHGVHCFSFGGIEQLDEAPHFRIDFLAAERLRRPDVEGTAWLDSATFALRQLTLRLTRPERAVRGIRSVEVTVQFGDVLPALSVPSHVVSVTTLTGRGGRRLEEQRFLRLEFLRGAPGR